MKDSDTLQNNQKTTSQTPSSPHLDRDTVAAFIVCCNEEKNIERCLKSVTWCDEIVIVDSGSTDKTLEICKRYTDKIHFHSWRGFTQQKQLGLDLCTKTWVINLDADEEVSQTLKESILDVLEKSARGEDVSDGYNICRVVYFLNRWWVRGGWYPEYRLRFLKKEKTVWGGNNPHEKAIVSGKVSLIKGHLHHYTYDNFNDQILALNKHSTVSAQHLHVNKKRFHLYNLFFNPLIRFFKFYILKRGFLEGLPGFLVACNEGIYTFQKYSKLWELEKNNTQ
ncbi:MAG: glycosyltransferase family 2 protein [Bdellovibrionota bacterium]|jgi:glycosyltransferase involved in cell wall biosynthesis